MAYSSAVLNATDTALAAADKPLFCANNILREAEDVDWNTTGTTSGSDETDADFPTTRLYDGSMASYSKIDASSSINYIAIDPPGTDVFSDFDCIFLGPNTFSDDGVTSMQLQIADDAAFTTNVATLASWSSFDNARIANLALDHIGSDARVYSDVQHLRIKFISTGVSQPALSELVIGSRVQMAHKSDLPWSPYGFVSDGPRPVSRSGVAKYYARTKGLGQYTPTITVDSDTYYDRLTGMFVDSDYGVRSIVYVEDPDTSPGSWRLVKMSEPTFYAQHINGTSERVWSAMLRELPPVAGLEE